MGVPDFGPKTAYYNRGPPYYRGAYYRGLTVYMPYLPYNPVPQQKPAQSFYLRRFVACIVFRRVLIEKKTWVDFFLLDHLASGHAHFFPLDRGKRKIVSPLLKVVETQIWAQNDRNSRVYISTYNNPKL